MILLRLLCVLALAGASGPLAGGQSPGDDFDRKAAMLFHKTFFAHPWNETEHTVEGEDWSLPAWVKPAPYSGIQISEKLVGPEFPGRIQKAVTVSWRQLEATEGVFDFEEYTKAHLARFGPIETFPHRYRESTLRMLQMRRNFVWAEGGPWLVNPPLLHYLTMELGQTVRTAPDAWCYLRESTLRGGRHGRVVKNFERWLYQRDADGARTEATARVEIPEQMFEFHPDHRYDCTARKTRSAEGQTRIRLALDDAFLAGGPQRVAVKITYLDCGHARWQLEHLAAGGQRVTREVSCGDIGTARTVTFLPNGAFFPETGFRGADLVIRAVEGDATIRLVRVIKLDPPPTGPAEPGPSATNSKTQLKAQP